MELQLHSINKRMLIGVVNKSVRSQDYVTLTLGSSQVGATIGR